MSDKPMTVGEWLREETLRRGTFWRVELDDDYERCWQAAQAAMNERCAMVCDEAAEILQHDESKTQAKNMAEWLAIEIRNVGTG